MIYENDRMLLERAVSLLERFGTERTGWRRLVFGRWYYRDEPLRNDAASLVRAYGSTPILPYHTHLVGDDDKENILKTEFI